MSSKDIGGYISWLKIKASTLGTLPRKELEKKIAVAEKIREQHFQSGRD